MPFAFAIGRESRRVVLKLTRRLAPERIVKSCPVGFLLSRSSCSALNNKTKFTIWSIQFTPTTTTTIEIKSKIHGQKFRKIKLNFHSFICNEKELFWFVRQYAIWMEKRKDNEKPENNNRQNGCLARIILIASRMVKHLNYTYRRNDCPDCPNYFGHLWMLHVSAYFFSFQFSSYFFTQIRLKEKNWFLNVKFHYFHTIQSDSSSPRYIHTPI